MEFDRIDANDPPKADPRTRSRGRLETGALYMTVALGLSLFSAFLPYFWAATLAPTVPSADASWAYVLHVVVIPMTGLALGAVVAALSALGYVLIRQRATGLEAVRISRLRLADLALLAAAAAFIVFTFAGIVLALLPFPAFVGVHRASYILFTIGIGAFLYWTIEGIGPRFSNLAGIAALVLGIGGVLLIRAPAFALGGAASPELDAVGSVFAFASLAVWFAIYLRAYGSLRLRGIPPLAGAMVA